jgi:hypothetical protein
MTSHYTPADISKTYAVTVAYWLLLTYTLVH